jgi:hypothetical protein
VADGAPEFGERTAEKRAGEAASAAAALPLVLELVPGTTSMVQVGIGGGEWLAEAQRLGVAEVHGIDGPWTTLDGLLVGPDQVTLVDTRERFDSGDREYDLAVCSEYAEHLPASRAASFVADLASLAPVIAFSAAIPGQGGTGHVNEQWPSYWEAHFAAVGYRLVDAVRRRLWGAPGAPFYLAQNLLIAVDDRRLADYPRLAEVAIRPDGGALSLVHPLVYEDKLRQIASPGIRAASRSFQEAVVKRARRGR